MGAAVEAGGRRGTISKIVYGSRVTGGTARDLLVTLTTTIAVALVAIVAMVMIATGVTAAGSSVAVIGLLALAVMLPGVVRRRSGRRRRRLRRRVGDPSTVSGVWRRLLAGAWAARDQFATVVDELAPSPLADRLADHQSAIDATLERCGSLARDGELMARQLRGFRARRLRRDLQHERRRDRHGPRARALASQLEEVDRLTAHLKAVYARLETRVHDLRSAAWRATALRTDRADDDDSALEDLLVDLTHLREAMQAVDLMEQPRTVVDSDHPAHAGSTAAVARRYDG